MRGLVIVNGCHLCLQAEESGNHLLLWCPTAYYLWTVVYGLLEINWVMAGVLRDEVWVWEGLCIKQRIANLIPHIVFGFCENKEMIEFLRVNNVD